MSAHAQGAARTVGVYRDWTVFVLDEGTERICYAVHDIRDKSPASVNHGEVFFFVSSWKSGVARNQPSFRAGYNLKPTPAPTIRIGSDRWEMYTAENEGYIEAAAAETRLVDAMRRGSDMRISAVSARGTATSYVVSLLGVTAALDRAAQECR